MRSWCSHSVIVCEKGCDPVRVAVTADVHLRTGTDYPERLSALRNVLQQATAEDIEHVIVAGDLFDKDLQDYSGFEGLCKDNSELTLHIIPGNHDPQISERVVVGANIHVYAVPTPLELDGTTFLFVPYVQGMRMGEMIARLDMQLPSNWVLVGHGDYYEGVREPSALEPGTYMPLCRGDMEHFKPQAALLGHIHKPFEQRAVLCPGSPCGLDITETGKRRFIIYDTATGSMASRHVDTDVIYFDEAFLVVPSEGELEALADQASARIQSWDIELAQHSKVQVRVEARGYTSNRSAVDEALRDAFRGLGFFKDEDPKISELKVASDPQRNAIAERAVEQIDHLDWSFGGTEPTLDDIRIAALSVIYGD